MRCACGLSADMPTQAARNSDAGVQSSTSMCLITGGILVVDRKEPLDLNILFVIEHKT